VGHRGLQLATRAAAVPDGEGDARKQKVAESVDTDACEEGRPEGALRQQRTRELRQFHSVYSTALRIGKRGWRSRSGWSLLDERAASGGALEPPRLEVADDDQLLLRSMP